MHESDIWLMPEWKRRLLGVKYEFFSTHINTLSIKFDQIPNPTKEERETGQIPVEGRRYTATHWPGKLVLRSLSRNNHRGPSSLTRDGACLEVYPIPKGKLK